MPINTKEYIALENLSSTSMYTKKEVVELTDFSNATDLEKLEWVLKEIGIQHKILSEYNQHFNGTEIFTDMIEDMLCFDSNGKLIK